MSSPARRQAIDVLVEVPRSFTSPRQAALCLLGNILDLTHREAGFLGHVCIVADLSDRQRKWLAVLLERHGLPPLAEGDAP